MLVPGPPSPAGVLTTSGGGGGRGVAPFAPDPSLLGAVDAKGVAAHLHEVDGAGLQACQAAGGLVAPIVHPRGGQRRVRGGACGGGWEEGGADLGAGPGTFQSTLSSTR